MLDPLKMSLTASGAGMELQSRRFRVVAENIANAESTGSTPGAAPYARKLMTVDSEAVRGEGVRLPRVRSITADEATPFRVSYDPGHPAADDKGLVRRPNVDILIESADLREANRSYQGNLQTYKQARELVAMTLELLKV